MIVCILGLCRYVLAHYSNCKFKEHVSVTPIFVKQIQTSQRILFVKAEHKERRDAPASLNRRNFFRYAGGPNAYIGSFVSE